MAITSNKVWVDDNHHSLSGVVYPPPMTAHQIQGQLITATMEIDPIAEMSMNDVDIKCKLLNALAIELLSAKCIEFTKQQDFTTNAIKVRARIFATPDSQVRIIRELTK